MTLNFRVGLFGVCPLHTARRFSVRLYPTERVVLAALAASPIYRGARGEGGSVRSRILISHLRIQ